MMVHWESDLNACFRDVLPRVLAARLDTEHDGPILWVDEREGRLDWHDFMGPDQRIMSTADPGPEAVATMICRAWLLVE
jgi:hypothetical protein